MTVCEIAGFCYGFVKVFKHLGFLHSTGRFITHGLGQHFGPIRNVNIFKKKGELSH